MLYHRRIAGLTVKLTVTMGIILLYMSVKYLVSMKTCSYPSPPEGAGGATGAVNLDIYSHNVGTGDVLNVQTLSQKISEGELVVDASANQRRNRKYVIGIPTVRRQNSDVIYVIASVTSLIKNLSEEERDYVIIVVYVAEPNNHDYVFFLKEKIVSKFPAEFECGLIEIIYPRPGLYPDLSNLKPSYGDSEVQLRWRTKQVLDHSVLMLFSVPRGEYFLLLEDDYTAGPGYLTDMEQFINLQKSDRWIAIHFGFTASGLLYRTGRLWAVVEYLLLFHQDRPVDLLLGAYFRSLTCEVSPRDCRHWFRLPYGRQLFHHRGRYSSLPGKTFKIPD